MLKTFEKYLIKLFLKKIIIVTSIFLSLILILSIFDEINFFKDLNTHFFYPFFMTFLNSPTALFETFPFIFLISTQFFFIELIDKDELGLLKIQGLDNFKIIKLLFLSSFVLGLFLISFYYQFSSKLKFVYLDIKNNYSNDHKYLAVVNDNGLWIKDEINKRIYIINASVITGNKLKQVTITEFDKDFNLLRLINSNEVDISTSDWVIFKPKISINNKSEKLENNIILNSHFNVKKINQLFSNLNSLNFPQLLKLNTDYKSLGYSNNEILSHLNRIISFPLYFSIMTMLSAVIMLNIKRGIPKIFHVVLGILLSVLIYYCYFLFSLVSQSANIPPYVSIWLPLVFLVTFIIIGLIKINEK
tara:strand:+ start:633 stop:1712 length:1080 start_codon:yes stop_codon:yes gene_type:complete